VRSLSLELSNGAVKLAIEGNTSVLARGQHNQPGDNVDYELKPSFEALEFPAHEGYTSCSFILLLYFSWSLQSDFPKSLIKPLPILFAIAWATSPMSPNRRKYIKFADSFSHICDFDFRVLGSVVYQIGLVMPDFSKTRKVKGREERRVKGTHGKYRSVFAGKTSILALIACIAALKSPLYGSCFETSAACHVSSIVSIFSGSEQGN
jgi:hypothetical protein